MPKNKKPPAPLLTRRSLSEAQKQQAVCRLIREHGPNLPQWGSYEGLLSEVSLLKQDVTKAMLLLAVKEAKEIERAEILWLVHPWLVREGPSLTEVWWSRDGTTEVRRTFEPGCPPWCVAVRLERGGRLEVGPPTLSLRRAFEAAEGDWRERFCRPLATSNKELVLDEHEALPLVVEREEKTQEHDSDNVDGGTKKRLAPAGVVDFLIGELRKASRERPVTRKDLLRRMEEKFSPERSKEQLNSTLSSQLSRHLRGRKGLSLVKTGEGWYIDE